MPYVKSHLPRVSDVELRLRARLYHRASGAQDGWIKSDLEKRHVLILQIGDEHVPRCVGDDQRQGC